MKIADIIDHYISGDWGNDDYSDETPKEVFCVRGADIVPITNTDFKNIPLRYIALRSFNDKLLSEGDIVIEKSGGSPTQSTGRVVYISKELVDSKKNIVCSNFCAAFRVKDEWNPKFVYYYFLLVYDSGIFFNFEGKTSGLKNLQMETAFKSIDIPVVDRKIQDKIVDELSLLDKKIALNREENATLEAMAKQLYDYWFVQFDFPDANGNPYKSSGGKMVWNEKLKREIPEGWEVSKLSSLLKFNKNGDWGTDDPTPTNGLEVNCVRGADIVKMDSLPIRYINSKNTEKLMQGGDLVVEISGGSPTQATGRVNYISEELLQIYNGKIICSNFCQYLRLKDVTLSEYFYYLWQLLYDNDNMFHYEGKTSGLKNLQIDTLLTESWYFPPSHIIEKFREVTLKTLRNRARTIKENKELTNLRDFLLPLLMNGQVSIKE